jgi:predicted 3-demethylubiquinone-9 3-methyltransferase (glyoxalase superfamily)
MPVKQKITTSLWFDGDAEEAANLYTSLFKNSKITNISRWGDVGPGEKGTVLTVMFELDGQEFIGINGGPEFKFSEAISLMVNCESQEEVDFFWDRLTADGGEESMCGWLKDKFGLSWQIVPTVLGELVGDPDPAKANRATEAMLKMRKLDIQTLQDAHAGR